MINRTTLKKAFAGVLAAATLIGMTPVTSFAEDSGDTGVKYVMMNVPYDDFYASYNVTESAVWEVETGVDAVSTATTSKFAGTTGLANGTYNNGKYIMGVTIPVQVSEEDYKELGNALDSSVALGTAADYAFSDLNETPEAYSTLTIDDSGDKSFSAFGASNVKTDSLSVGEMTTSGSYGDFQVSLIGVTTTKKKI